MINIITTTILSGNVIKTEMKYFGMVIQTYKAISYDF